MSSVETEKSPILYAECHYSRHEEHARNVATDEARRVLARMLVDALSDGREYAVRTWVDDGYFPSMHFTDDVPAIRAYALVALVDPRDAQIGEFVRRETVGSSGVYEVTTHNDATRTTTRTYLVFHSVKFRHGEKSIRVWRRVE